MADLSAAAVAARLEALRRLYVPESTEDARKRLASEEEPVTRNDASLSESAARRLAELRALCELTDYLHTRAK